MTTGKVVSGSGGVNKMAHAVSTGNRMNHARAGE